MSLVPANPELLARLSLFAIARPDNLARFDRSPFGIELVGCHDPLVVESAPFLRRLERLDALTFGPEGMPMPRWVFLDGAEMTGGIVGFAIEAAALSERIRDDLAGDAGDGELIPLSMFIAIPTAEPGVWFAHNLASAASLVELDLRGLGSLTKAVALRVFGARAQIGATQWDSRALFVHTRLGALELLAADAPAHGDANTLTYRARITDGALRHLARDPSGTVELPEPDEWVDSADLDRRLALQAAIEGGARYAIAGRPQVSDGGLRVPIARLVHDLH